MNAVVCYQIYCVACTPLFPTPCLWDLPENSAGREMMEARKVEETRALVRQATTLLREHLRQTAPHTPLSLDERQSLRTLLQLLLPSLSIVRSYSMQHHHSRIYTTIEGAIAQLLTSAALDAPETRGQGRTTATTEQVGVQQAVAPAREGQSTTPPVSGNAGGEAGRDVSLRTAPTCTAAAATVPDVGSTPLWKDIYGCADAVLALRQATTLPLRYPSLFTGPRQPWRKLLLYGPPGTGKTQLAAATAAEYGAVFLSVSAADLLSKWVGESEKQVRQAFAQAATARPRCVLFFDEIDALCGARGGHGESELARRLKTEFLLHLQTAAPTVLVLAATNMPWELDAAVVRRFERFIHVGLPSLEDKLRFLTDELRGVAHAISGVELRGVAAQTEGFSLVDMRRLLSYAVMAPVSEWLAKRSMHEAHGAVEDSADGRDIHQDRCWASPPPTSPPAPLRCCCNSGSAREGIEAALHCGVRHERAEGGLTTHRRLSSNSAFNTSSSTSVGAYSFLDELPSPSRSSSAASHDGDDVPVVEVRHFEDALRCVSATSAAADAARHMSWTSRTP